MPRETGFYWVKSGLEGGWKVVFWSDAKPWRGWHANTDDTPDPDDSRWDYIHETKLIPPDMG
jgi:hypothetical protein